MQVRVPVRVCGGLKFSTAALQLLVARTPRCGELRGACCSSSGALPVAIECVWLRASSADWPLSLQIAATRLQKAQIGKNVIGCILYRFAALLTRRRMCMSLMFTLQPGNVIFLVDFHACAFFEHARMYNVRRI